MWPDDPELPLWVNVLLGAFAAFMFWAAAVVT